MIHLHTLRGGTHSCAKARFTSSTVHPYAFSTTMNTAPSPFSNSSLPTGGNVANAHDAFGCVHSGPYCAYRHSGNVGRCVSRIETASGTAGGGGGDGEGEGVGRWAEIERRWWLCEDECGFWEKWR